jgi:hypothetical protein
VFLWILYRLLWGCTVRTVSVFVLCVHFVSDSMSLFYYWSMEYTKCLKSSDTFLGTNGGNKIKLDRKIDKVVWEAVILSGPVRCVPWKHCFSSGNISPRACFGHSGPQSLIPISFISFCELIPGSGIFCHSEKWGWCAHTLHLETVISEQCWILRILFTICQYISGINDKCVCVCAVRPE